MRSQITETLLSDIRKVQPKVSKEDSRRIKESPKIINTALSLPLSHNWLILIFKLQPQREKKKLCSYLLSNCTHTMKRKNFIEEQENTTGIQRV